MRRANAVIQVGAMDQDVEADEGSFRNWHIERGDEKLSVWTRFLGVVRRGSSLVYLGELDEREQPRARGGGGPIGEDELQKQVLHRPGGRPLMARGSILHTDKASTYLHLHRVKGHVLYRRLGLWVTQVRHSRHKDKKTGKWQSVQFTVRKKVQLLKGKWEWRKGGTQKKDGFWSLIRKYVSRRAIKSDMLPLLRQTLYFYQWLYWRSNDPVADAFRGIHLEDPCVDL